MTQQVVMKRLKNHRGGERRLNDRGIVADREGDILYYP